MNLSGRKPVCPYPSHLEAFWDTEVSPEERRRIEAHLSECAACRQSVQELQRLAGALKAYRTPAGGRPSESEFWERLAPQLRPRAIPSQESQAGQPSPLLAPVSLVLSSLALRGVAALALIAYALHEWQLLPAAVPAAFASAGQLVLGPWVWPRGQLVYGNLVTSLAPFLAAPEQVWLLVFEATISALLLLIAGLHIGWLLRWLGNPSSSQAMTATE
jgi:predicted anti-sigma-YlaC factor YlaD